MPRPDLAHSGRVLFAILTLALIGVLATSGCDTAAVGVGSGSGQPDMGGAVGINAGDVAPDFTLTDLNGNQVTLSDFRGKTVLLNFWATWCPPCRKEMPDIESLYQEYRDRDVVVIGVDIAEGVDRVRQYVEKGGYSWTFVIDAGYETSVRYKVRAIPSSFFIDEDGIIRVAHVGYMTKKAMDDYLAKAMA